MYRPRFGALLSDFQIAFNAALAIFGSLLVPLDGSRTASAGQPGTARLDRGRTFLQKAVTGLSHLGRKNIILDRCINYLKQLHGLVDRWGK